YRVPVYLFYYEGYRTDEIAQMLDVPGATVRTRLARARKRLATVLGEGGIDD
ncbi:MAG: RNA polymerase subunit sigma-24, partial [Atopobiaceae bacterium]|nr:RNA polymerase subunit sigma-24 [Atopobiaceae bacterium]